MEMVPPIFDKNFLLQPKPRRIYWRLALQRVDVIFSFQALEESQQHIFFHRHQVDSLQEVEDAIAYLLPKKLSALIGPTLGMVGMYPINQMSLLFSDIIDSEAILAIIPSEEGFLLKNNYFHNTKNSLVVYLETWK